MIENACITYQWGILGSLHLGLFSDVNIISSIVSHFLFSFITIVININRAFYFNNLENVLLICL